MHKNARFALDHPVFDPLSQILEGHFWQVDRRWSAGLTVNIGVE